MCTGDCRGKISADHTGTETIISSSDLSVSHRVALLLLFPFFLLQSTLPTHTHTHLSVSSWWSKVEYWFSLVESSCWPQTPHTHKSHSCYHWERSPIDPCRLFVISQTSRDWCQSDIISVHMSPQRKLDIERQEAHANWLKPEWLVWARWEQGGKPNQLEKKRFIAYFQCNPVESDSFASIHWQTQAWSDTKFSVK